MGHDIPSLQVELHDLKYPGFDRLIHAQKSIGQKRQGFTALMSTLFRIITPDIKVDDKKINSPYVLYVFFFSCAFNVVASIITVILPQQSFLLIFKVMGCSAECNRTIPHTNMSNPDCIMATLTSLSLVADCTKLMRN